ncbi:unnamed protein product, partial [Musa banksii]
TIFCSHQRCHLFSFKGNAQHVCQRTLYQPRNTLPAYKTGMGWSSKRNDSDTVRPIE